MDEHRKGLEAELRRLLKQAGATEETMASVMGSGCRLDGLGAGAVPEQLIDERHGLPAPAA